MTITINFTTIFAWIGGLLCLLVTLWALGWTIRGIVAVGELLGIWESLARGIRGSISWVWSRLARLWRGSASSEERRSSGS